MRKALRLKVMGFTEGANYIFNEALNLTEEFECEQISAVAVLIALCNYSEIGQEIASALELTSDDLKFEFGSMASSGRFGYREPEPGVIRMEKFTPLLHSINSAVSQAAIGRNKLVTIEDLMSCTISSMEWESDDDNIKNELREFNIQLGIMPHEWREAYSKAELSFSIPQELDMYIKDITASDELKSIEVANVDKYIDECIEILSRKKTANPCLIGPAGVGKTSIVNGMAKRIQNGNVPNQFKKTHICYLDGSTIAAGTRYRGDFEERMLHMLEWASDKNNNVILFIDEIAAFINAGKCSEDANGAGNLVKKYLSDGAIRIIGTTTTEEYHKFIEKDKAFDRRLQVVEVKEPTVDEAITMVKGSIGEYTQFHGVQVGNDVIELAVKTTDTYMRSKALPDKAYAVLDQACAKTKLSGRKSVAEKTILDIVSKATGVNIRELKRKDTSEILSLGKRLKKNIIGQDNAVEQVERAIKRSKAGVHDKNRPLATFLFIGPTGVGKTEVCKQLCKELGLGKEQFIKLDMSEYSEKSSISKLIGSAPGYVGYGEGGHLTEKIKHNPYSIVLLDEIEKANDEVFNAILQLLDEGRLTDGSGVTIDCTNCIIVMTSNVGYGLNEKSSTTAIGFGADSNSSSNSHIKAVEDTFRPEFINRIDSVVEFSYLDTDSCGRIVQLELNKISNRIMENKQIGVKFNRCVVDSIVKTGYNKKYGARNLKRELQNIVEDQVADMILSGEMKQGEHYSISIRDGILTIDKTGETNMEKKELSLA